MIFDFAVIGGGAAGLSAAISFHNSEPQKTENSHHYRAPRPNREKDTCNW